MDCIKLFVWNIKFNVSLGSLFSFFVSFFKILYVTERTNWVSALQPLWLIGVGHRPRVREVSGSTPSRRRVIPKTLKMGHAASMLGAQREMDGVWGEVIGFIDNLSLGPGIGVAPTHTLVVTANERGAFGLPPTAVKPSRPFYFTLNNNYQ